jgi:hypothetical protein
MGLIIKQPGHKARPLEPVDLPVEITLQNFVVENPNSLPLRELRDDLEFLMVAKELPTDSGPIDAAGLDDEGNVYLIETKLFRNPDKRQVVAQVLDYGAALWREHGDPRTFLEKLDAATRKLVGDGLTDLVSREFGLDHEQTEALLHEIEATVRGGRFRFVVLMDRLDDRLKSLISFINENSRFDVYAVELELYRFDSYEAVIPRLYGAEARKELEQPPSKRRVWDEATFFADAVRRLPPEALQGLRRLYDFSLEHADQVTWGTGAGVGSFNPKYAHISPRSVFTVYSKGRIDLNFKWLHEAGEPLPDPVRRMAERLNQIPGLRLPEGYEKAHPHLRPEAWTGKVEELIAAIRETLRTA